MSDDSEKKKDHLIFVNVASTVIAGVILLVCTTIYNLVLAHIWPVTIHFGEYSLNNLIFILVSIISSLLLAVIILSLEMLYVLNSFGRGLLSLVTPPEKRKHRKHRWFEYILDGFLYASMGMVTLLLWLTIPKYRKEEKQSVLTEETRPSYKDAPHSTEQKPEQKHTS
jgi:hypothetical protein